MPDPDFSVNDVRLCVGKCLLLFGDHHSMPELRPGQTEKLGVTGCIKARSHVLWLPQHAAG